MNTPEPAETNTVEPELKAATSSTGAPEPVHVWLVDDHANLRALIAETLERHGGIVCTRQFHSPNALLSALASRVGPDVILLDVQMGDANGIDAIPAIKSLSRPTRVLMLTTCYDLEWHQQALESGAAGYLLKTDPLERLTGSICSRGDEADLGMMRGEPVPIKFRRPRASCASDSKTKAAQPAPASIKKETAFMRWLRRFAKN